MILRGSVSVAQAKYVCYPCCRLRGSVKSMDA